MPTDEPRLPDPKELEKEVLNNVRAMRDDGMKQVYMERMKKLGAEVAKTGMFSQGLYPEFTPQQFIQVAWGDGDTETVALNGNPLAAKNITDKPSYLFDAHDGTKYCLVAFDADATGGPNLLWVRFGIEGETKYSSGRDWFRWQAPTPARDTGKHRVFFMIFHQKHDVDRSRLKTISKFSREGRSGFRPADFARKFGFDIVVGCNSIVTEWDASVDKTMGSLKDEADLDENKGKVAPDANPCDGVYDYGSKAP